MTSAAEPFRRGVFEAMTVILAKKDDSRLRLEGYGVRRDADGDEWYSQLDRSDGEPGRYEIRGGTGRYKGVVGTCAYEVLNRSSGGASLGDCEWRRAGESG